MPIELKMPALSPTMEKGTLAKWLVATGDVVRRGDLIAEVETDKATMELEAEEDGTLAEIAVPGGSEDVAVGTVIARLLSDGENLDIAPASAPQEAVEPIVISAPTEPTPEIAAAAPPLSTLPVVKPAEHAPGSRPTFDDIRATPLASRIAGIMGLPLSGIQGSGPRGKIIKADLGLPSRVQPTLAEAAPIQTAVSLAPPSTEPPAGIPVRREKLSSMRKTIARRLSSAKQQIPHFYLTVRCNLDPLLALRTTLNATLEAQGIKLSVNDMLIKALAIALDRVPDANVQFGGDELYRFDRIDVAMAVAINGGLVTPVLRDVGAMSLSRIAKESKALATRAREGKLVPHDYEGGTASISNLGMFGVDEMVPVINPPQALILGVAAGIRQPWEIDGQVGIATLMAATGSFDHRAIDGATGAQFMAAFKDVVEKPLLICA